MPHDFDTLIAREHTDSVKWDARQAVFGRADLLPMWVADMDFPAPPAVTRALLERAAHPIYGYTVHPDALPAALADWLERRHGWRIQPDWVLWSPGVVPALYAAVRAFAAPGEGVIVQPPVYHPFFSAVTDNARRLVLNPLRREGDRYVMDLEQLERQAADARLLLLCSPHNPVGRVWRREELTALLKLCRRHDLVVLADEIHHDLVHPGHRHTPLATLTDDPGAIVTTVAPSKTFNIPGLGLSALIVPDPGQRAALARVFGELHVGAGNPFSIAAFIAAYQAGEPWLDDLLAYLAGNRDYALDFIARRLPGIRAVAPEGTYLLWLDCRGLNMDDAALRDFCIQQARVGMSPGIGFGSGGEGHMRLNLGAPRAILAEALDRLAEALDRREQR